MTYHKHTRTRTQHHTCNVHPHAQVPFSLMATAYRRKRLMEGIISGDKETMGQIVQLSERQAQVRQEGLCS